MPNYVKFLKEILSKKRRFEDYEKMMLNEECSAIILNKLPLKSKDLRSFIIPCKIGNCEFDKALCDLGASINLMPYSVFRKLRLGEVKSTTISLQLADRSMVIPRCVVKDVLIKVNKFIFPVDFVVLDMVEDKEVPLILGRPFLATSKALIDVHKGTLTFRVGHEEVKFNVSSTSKVSMEKDECFRIEVVNESLSNLFSEPKLNDFDKIIV
ncbi:uncharacterized protein LOC131183748 [Hevea brasiliensis]|uniref:uncharacterized protein LOC131183748 n=1 Tax=Hevea brasiliensis TaxID=3981 RepID=UPI0025DF155E|nr:uncharacterized protein LOC131183748 [Hevea brasiliensis]